MGRTRSQQGPLFALGGGPGAPDEGSVQPPSKGSPRLLPALRPCGTELGCDVNPRKPREDGRLNPPSAVSCHAAAGDPSQRPRRGLRRRSRHAVPQPPAGHPCSSGGRSFGHAGGHSRDGRVWLRPRELMLLSQGHVWPCLSLAAPPCGGAWRLRGARRAGSPWPGSRLASARRAQLSGPGGSPLLCSWCRGPRADRRTWLCLLSVPRDPTSSFLEIERPENEPAEPPAAG